MKKIFENKTILSILVVVLIIAVVVGGTFAYWSWSTNTAQETAVTFQVSGGSLTIDGGGNITASDVNGGKLLAPAACTNTTYAIQRKVKITAVNETATAMTATVNLKVASLTAAHGTLNDTNKGNIKIALVPSDSTNHAKTTTWLGCTATGNQSKTMSGISTGSTINLIGPSQSSNSFKITVPANGTTNNYYELYVWIDPSYTGETTQGNNVTDPLQDLTLNLTWDGSMTNEA